MHPRVVVSPPRKFARVPKVRIRRLRCATPRRSAGGRQPDQAQPLDLPQPRQRCEAGRACLLPSAFCLLPSAFCLLPSLRRFDPLPPNHYKNPMPPPDPVSAGSSPSLDALRVQIDALDERLVELLNERARVVVEIGKLKQQNNSPIYAPDREKLVLQKVRKLNHGPLPDRCLEAVYRELMSGSFALEKPLRIGFLGPAGSFSHSASLLKFGSSVEYVPLSDIPGVFEEVVRGHIDYGLVPVENSLQDRKSVV